MNHVIPFGAVSRWEAPARNRQRSSQPSRSSAQNRLLSLLKSHGYNATSFQTLSSSFEYMFDGDDACIAYADTGAAWVVAGAPIAEGARLDACTQKFVARARAQQRRVCFVAVERRFTERSGLRMAKIGEQPVWDTGLWQQTLRSSRSLREQLRRARARGVTVRPLSLEECENPRHPTRRALDALIERWLGSRGLAPLGFLVDVKPFAFCGERRYFMAERGGRPLGLLVLAPVFQREGYLVEHFLRDPEAPNGTVELLIHEGMCWMAAQGFKYATLGLVPLVGELRPELALLRRLTRRLYDCQGLYNFKAKLRPAEWHPIYIAYPKQQSLWLTMVDVLSVLSQVGLPRFALASLKRKPVQTLARLTRLNAPRPGSLM